MYHMRITKGNVRGICKSLLHVFAMLMWREFSNSSYLTFSDPFLLYLTKCLGIRSPSPKHPLK